MPNKSHNPFTPTFGHVPFALAGRGDYIDDVIGGLANCVGDPNRSTIFVGPRGSGKTVLITAIARAAEELGWISVGVSARNGMLDEAISQLRSRAARLLPDEPASDITAFRAGPIGLSREMRHGETTWRTRMAQMLEALNGQGTGLLLTVDEVDPRCEELRELVDAYQHFIREERDVALMLAGLPGRVSALLLDENVSFIRRAFQRPLAPIPQIEVEQTLYETIVANGRAIDDDALAAAAEAAGGFAFAIQLIGYYLWRQGADDRPLVVDDATRAVERARIEMERSVFLPTLRDLRPREVQYLQTMAQDDGPSATSAIAKRMGISMTNASNIRRRLVEHGIISEVRMGLVEFEMPLLKEYLAS